PAAVPQDSHPPAPRPPDGADVGAEQPERRPEPLPRRELDTRFDPARRDWGFVPRCDFRGRIGPGPVAAGQPRRRDAGGDLELALPVQLNVRRVGGVVLLLVVPPTANVRAAVAQIVSPI